MDMLADGLTPWDVDSFLGGPCDGGFGFAPDDHSADGLAWLSAFDGGGGAAVRQPRRERGARRRRRRARRNARGSRTAALAAPRRPSPAARRSFGTIRLCAPVACR